MFREDGVGQQGRDGEDGQQERAVPWAAKVGGAEERVTDGDHADADERDRRREGRAPQWCVLDEDREALSEPSRFGGLCPFRQQPGDRDRGGDQNDGDDQPRRPTEETREPGPGERGDGEGHGVEAAGSFERLPGDRRQLSGPPAGDGGVEQPGDGGDRDAQRQVAENGGDDRESAGVPGERQGQQPPGRRAAVEEGPEDGPADGGRGGQPGEQRRAGVRAQGEAEQEEGGSGQLVAGPRQRRADQVTP
ncbi:hypothetical protein M8542_35450 [Amycolatopsis sp. OK19-0408]|uniref:Uncharacterized protein n=1 Tax=Amycolatopsis iheyensis TaxID=2945988 RepID=A0A9X2SMT1_9PSEU|nr:hypothetical protein [Amycolatopsis iheyensis]MCR6488137.1 hypothetical protein [Amycolatopsis iheyensis]